MQCQQQNGYFSAAVWVTDLPHNTKTNTREGRLVLESVLHSQVGSLLHSTSSPFSQHWMRFLPFSLYLSENTREKRVTTQKLRAFPPQCQCDQEQRKGSFKANRRANTSRVTAELLRLALC